MKIKVDTAKLNNQFDSFNRVQKRLNSISDKLMILSNKRDWDDIYDGIAESIKYDISSYTNAIELCSSKASIYCQFLQNAVNRYDTCERELNDRVLGKNIDNYTFNATQTIGIVNSSIGDATLGGLGISAIQKDVSANKKEDEDTDLFGTIAEGALISSGAVALGAFMMEGNILGGEVKTLLKSSLDFKKGELVGLEAKIAATGYVTQGKIFASCDYAKFSATGSVGKVSASGEVGASLFKNGKLSPSLQAKAEASAAGINGKVKGQLGNDKYNIYGEINGTVGHAKAEASAGIGKIQWEDSSGNTKTGYGVQAKVSAEAYALQGSTKAGFNLFGIDIGLEVKGKLGGAGVNAGGQLTASSASGEIGVGLLAGVGLKVDVDWSKVGI